MAETFSPAMERFFEELRKTPRDWLLDRETFVKHAVMRRVLGKRCDGTPDSRCPLCEVANLTSAQRVYRLDFFQAAEVVGLTRDEALEVATAADDARNERFNPAIRARLLECCGLTEVGSG